MKGAMRTEKFFLLVQKLGVCGNTYIAVRCLTGLTGWILDIYISNYEKDNPHLKQPIPTMNLFFFVSINKFY
jgi:hypothetical protein